MTILFYRHGEINDKQTDRQIWLSADEQRYEGLSVETLVTSWWIIYYHTKLFNQTAGDKL